MAYIIHLLFFTYTIMILVRVISSWFPSIQGTGLIRFLAFCTDPYLNIFRKIIPPIGGVLDISPILAFFALQLMEYLILLVF